MATVDAVRTGGMLDAVLADFEARTTIRVEVTVGGGTAIYNQARAGGADIVVSHLDIPQVEAFVGEGLGQWPRPFVATSVVFVVPAADPARVRTAKDPVAAFHRIARHRAPFIVNDLPELVYLTDIIWNATGRPDKSGWYQDTGLRGAAAVQEAARQGGYNVWGLHPFVTQPQPAGMEPVVFNDSLVQQVIASVVVDPEEFPTANVDGAVALQEYLREPATQARMRAFRVQGTHRPVFWPAGTPQRSP